jgi:hypothetical protein
MALSPIEDRYLSTLTEREFPTFTPDQALMASPEGVDSVQLAAGPSATVSDAGSGMPEMRATPRNPAMGGVADFVRGVRDLANQYEIKDFVPLLGGMGVGDLLLGKSPEELEEWAYGNSPMRIPEMSNVPIVKTGRKEQLMDTMFLGVDAAGIGKGAGVAGKAAAKKLGPKAAEMVEGALQRQGLMPGVVEAGKTMAPSPTAPTDDLGFFSAVEQSAMNVQRKSGTGQAFLNDIAKGENVKADEIKWMGLDDFLKGKKNVTREEVQQFIAENRVEVKEVTLDNATANMKERQELEAMSNDELADAAQVYDFSSPTFREDAINRIIDNRNSYFDGYPEDDFRGGTKFGQYTLPGGENYREILLTLPTKGPSTINAMPDSELRALIMRNDSNADVDGLSRQDLVSMIDGMGLDSSDLSRLSVDNSTQFKSSHWEQPNVLAHIRVNDRVDADGKKMLLIEEVQSDWHQAGRDKGYKVKGPTELPSNLQIVENTYSNNPNTKFDVVNKETGLHSGWSGATPEQARDKWLASQARKTDKPDAVPDAPMKDTWYQLALKRALKYAADNGYERVGITTGARQAERYNLSSQVNQIVVTPRMNAATGEKTRSVAVDLKSDGILQLGVDKNGIVDNARGDFDNPAQFKGKPLADIIGKELAQKIMDAERATFEGAGLNVGGDGMKKYYDEVYPNFLDKYGKKWGAKVGETSVNIGTEDKMVSKLRERGYDPETVTLQEILSNSNGRTPSWLTEEDVLMLELGVELTSKGVQKEPIRYVDITPEMRQSVQKGQPLFTAAPIGAGTAGATMQDKENK